MSGESRYTRTEVEQLFEQLDSETCLKIDFEHLHCPQYAYKFPSGLVVVAMGDWSLNEGFYRMTVERAENINLDTVEKLDLVSFEDTPFSDRKKRYTDSMGDLNNRE